MHTYSGGGSANKTFLYQQTKALLNPDSLRAFLKEKITSLGTSACPPYHLAIVIGGLSAEMTLKTVKLASVKDLDNLPSSGDASGRAFRDLEWEGEVLKIAQDLGIGAQFGGACVRGIEYIDGWVVSLCALQHEMKARAHTDVHTHMGFRHNSMTLRASSSRLAFL